MIILRKVFLTIISVLGSLHLFAQSQFSGTITGNNDAQIFIGYYDSQHKSVTDSIHLQNGTFRFKLNITEPTQVYLSVKPAIKNNYCNIYLEPGLMTATGNYQRLHELKVTGSKTQDEQQALQAKLDEAMKPFEPIGANINRMNREVKLAKSTNKPEHIIDSLEKELVFYEKQRNPFADKYEAIVRQYVINHPHSYISAIQMKVYADSWPLDSTRMIYKNFSTAVQNSDAGLVIKKQIAIREANLSIKPAENFSKIDVNGKTISLTDFKGRYVLLDFWAHWCVPCREATPHLIELFNKYHKAGFDVIGVASDDDTQDDWRKAIKKDKTQIWYNVLSGPTDDKERIGNKYDVSSLPTKILIDKKGMIIGRYDGTEGANTLDKKLAEIFK